MFAKIRYAWNRSNAWFSTKINRIRHYLSDEGPAGNCFWWMDVLLLLGGLRSGETSKWVHERKIRIIFQILSVNSLIVFYFQLYEALNEKKDVSQIIMELTKVASISIGFLRMMAAAMLDKPFATLQRFVSSNSFNSGDKEYDKREQNKFNGFAKKAIQIAFFGLAAETMFMLVPSSTKDQLFHYNFSYWIGEKPSMIVNILLVSLIPATIFPKIVGCTLYIGVLLIGMRTKLRMLAHRFEMISQGPVLNDEQHFDRIHCELREFLSQHKVYLSILKVSKDLIGKMFLLVHYFSIFAVGALIYGCYKMERSFMTFTFMTAVSFFLLEYYLLCYAIDSLQDEAESIEQHIFDLCAKIPFRPECRSEYVQMRTTLMIIWMNTRNGLSMDCMGVFEINTPKFVAFLNVAYSVLTFLIQME